MRLTVTANKTEKVRNDTVVFSLYLRSKDKTSTGAFDKVFNDIQGILERMQEIGVMKDAVEVSPINTCISYKTMQETETVSDVLTRTHNDKKKDGYCSTSAITITLDLRWATTIRKFSDVFTALDNAETKTSLHYIFELSKDSDARLNLRKNLLCEARRQADHILSGYKTTVTGFKTVFVKYGNKEIAPRLFMDSRLNSCAFRNNADDIGILEDCITAELIDRTITPDLAPFVEISDDITVVYEVD